MNKVQFSDLINFDNSAILEAFKEIIAAYSEMIAVAKKSSAEIAAQAAATAANSDANKEKLEQALAEMKALQAQTKAYQKTLADLEAQNKKLKDQSDEKAKAEKAEIDRLKAIEDLSKQRAKAFEKQFAAQQKANDKAKEEAEIMGKQARSIAELAKQTAILSKQRREMDKYADPKKFNELTASINKNNNELKKFDAQIGNYQRNVGNYASAISAYGMSLADFATPQTAAIAGVTALATVFANAVVDAEKFNKAMSKVKSILSPTAEEFDLLSKSAMKAGEDTKYSALEAADAMAELGQSGFNSLQVIAALPAALDLAAIAEISVADGAKKAADLVQGFGLKASDTRKVVDILAKAATTSSVTVESMAESFKEITATAVLLKMPIEEVGAAISVLGNAGLRGTVATSTLETSLLNIANPTARMADTMKKLNLQFFDANGKFIGMRATLEMLEKATVNFTDKQKLATVGTLFGATAAKQWGSLLNSTKEVLVKDLTPAMREQLNIQDGVNKVMLKGSEVAAFYEGSLNDAAGASKFMAETLQDNLIGDLEKASGAWDSFTQSIFAGDTVLSNFFRNTTQGFTEFINIIGGSYKAVDLFAIKWAQFKDTVTSPTRLAKAVAKPFLGAFGGLLSSEQGDSEKKARETMKVNEILSKGAKATADEMAFIEKRLSETTVKAGQEVITSKREAYIREITILVKRIKAYKDAKDKEAEVEATAAKVKANFETLREQKEREKEERERNKSAKAASKKEDSEFSNAIKLQKLLADAMIDGEEKELELLRISFEDKKHELEKFGVDSSILTDAYMSERDQIINKHLQKQINDLHKANQDSYDADLKYFKSTQNLEQNEFNKVKRTKQEKADFELNQQIALYEEQLKLAEKYPSLISETEVDGIKKSLSDAKASLSEKGGESFDIWALLGFSGEGKEDGKMQKMKQMFSDTVGAVTDFFTQMADARVEAATRAVEASQKELDSAQSYADEQNALKDQGLANYSDDADKRLQIAKDAQAAALAEQEAAAKKKAQIESVSQTISLVSAVANIWKSATELGPIGWVLAGIQTAALFGSFLLAKKTAKDAAKIDYHDGGVFDIGGGTHASGNDTTIANTKGTQRRAERGEKVGVLTPFAARRYGRQFESFVSLANKGVLEGAFGGMGIEMQGGSKDYTGILSAQNGYLATIANSKPDRVETAVVNGVQHTYKYKGAHRVSHETIKL